MVARSARRLLGPFGAGKLCPRRSPRSALSNAMRKRLEPTDFLNHVRRLCQAISTQLPSISDPAGPSPLSARRSAVRDNAVIRFSFFADAAFVRSRSMQISASRHKSPNRSFASAFLAVTGTALSLRPSWATETRDEADLCRRSQCCRRISLHAQHGHRCDAADVTEAVVHS